ncbi:MAG: hypothetical protein AAFU49_00060 [Pseudomonadota bacterium]
MADWDGFRLTRTGLVSALLMVSLAACGWGWPNARYIPTQYTGRWAVTLTSEQCGEDSLQTYTATGGMMFRAYSDKYYFDFRHGVQKRSASGTARQNVEHTNPVTGKTAILEYPWFYIEFGSSDRGKGSWRASDCRGQIELTKVRE